MQAKEALSILVASFRQEKIEPETVKVYVAHLADIPGPLLKKTVSHLILHSRFFPSIAEIRETAAWLCGVLPPSAEEALGIVRQADVSEPKFDRAGRYCYTDHYWRWPENTTRAVMDAVYATLSAIGDPYTAEGKIRYGWDQAFLKTYERKAKEITGQVLSDFRAISEASTRKAITNGRSDQAQESRGLPEAPRHARERQTD